jgi:hypothetical protein
MGIDQCQPAVEIALQKEGWTIVASPRTLATVDEDFHIDLEARRLLENGSSNATTVYIEVKCFHSEGKYKRDDLYTAIGQYIVYRTIMQLKEVAVKLYLAVPSHVFEKFSETILKVLEMNKVNIIVVDLIEERITRWIG